VRAILLIVLLVGLAACAESGGTGEASSPSPADTAATPPADDLVVEIDRGDGSAPERYTLNCADIAGSDHPAAEAACEHLADMDDPFAPLPADMICAQVFDGPETARVTGRWHGEPVDLRLARNDSCRTTQWAGLGPLLPAAS
jgi:Subtilisin inhibitor-like